MSHLRKLFSFKSDLILRESSLLWYLTAKPNTSQQKQNSFGFAVGICFCREVFGFCCEVFGFAVRYFVFAVRFLVLP